MADTSKYLLAARQALQEKNYEDAKKYYEMVKIEDPTNAEAKIQYQFAKYEDCTNGQAYDYYTDYMNLLKHAVDNIAASDMPADEQIKFLSGLIETSVNAVKSCGYAMNRIRTEGDGTSAKINRIERENILFAKQFGDDLERKYGSTAEGMEAACKAWKSYVDRANGNLYIPKTEDPIILTYVEKIQKVDPSYNFVPKKRGCF